MKSQHKLSKSSFVYGCQCPKRLHLYKHNNKLRNPVTSQQNHIFETGSAVGVLAQQVFPGGVDCTPKSHQDFTESLQKTMSLVECKEPVIYEAAFQSEDGLLCAIDILVFREDGWHGYEVKSSTQVKDVHLSDASFQYHVLNKCGVTLTSIHVMHLSKARREKPLMLINCFAVKMLQKV